jgi:hypothetical protein
MVERAPDISAKAVVEKLKARAPDDLIQSVEDGEIFFIDTTVPELRVSGIPNRLSRIKKTLK